MKPFHLQKFTIEQSEDVFRVGTDGFLLGCLSSVENFTNILEIGTGTGLISLMLAQRNEESKILSIDIDEKAVKLAEKNFNQSPFSRRISAKHIDFKNFKSEEKFDLIISNPPFFEENASVKDVLARQKIELSYTDLISKSAFSLSSDGVLSVIIPSFDATALIEICKGNNLNLIRKINIYGIEGGVLRRNILEFSFQTKELILENFIIEKSPRKYSDQYLEATKDFHIFKK